MELSPQAVAAATFNTVRKGYDPDEVREFLANVSANLETARQQGSAMEARARAAIAKMQELAQQQQSPSGATADQTPSSIPRPIVAGPDDSETISRTLLLAQRTADLAVADARADAERILAEANVLLEEARATAASLIEEARNEARHSKEDELAKADEAVHALLARREFLLGDVEHLEQHVGAQRDRLRDAAVALHDLIERVPGGLGEVRRPLLSASAEPATTDLSPEDLSSEDLSPEDLSPEDRLPEDLSPDVAPAGEKLPADLSIDGRAAVRSDAFGSTRRALRVDLASGWQAADQVPEPDFRPASGIDDTQPIDVTPVDGQLMLGTDDLGDGDDDRDGGLRISGRELR